MKFWPREYQVRAPGSTSLGGDVVKFHVLRSGKLGRPCLWRHTAQWQQRRPLPEQPKRAANEDLKKL